MSKKITRVAAGALLGLGAMTVSANLASAGAAFPLLPLASAQSNATGYTVIPVAMGTNDRMRDRWESKRDGRRCSHRDDHCRHFHDGFYYEIPWWTMPLIVGGSVGYGDGYDRLSCGEARAMVRHRGYSNVSTIECNGRTYTFRARRGDHRVLVYVNSRSGAVWRG